jgi:hypothetical protein
MKIDENRNITVDLTKDEVNSLNSGLSITAENGVKVILPYNKIKNNDYEKIDNNF